MKKIYIIVALFVLCFATTNAQELSTSRSNFKGGLRVGMTTSQVSGDDLSGFHKVGAYCGGFANMPISSSGKWKLQLEMNFIMKGSQSRARKVNEIAPTNRYMLHLFYTETPLLISYNIFKGCEVELGTGVNFLFSYIEKDLNGSYRGRPAFRLVEWPIIAGVNYLIKDHYGISIRFSQSILPIRSPKWVFNRLVNKQFNTALAFSFYYQF